VADEVDDDAPYLPPAVPGRPTPAEPEPITHNDAATGPSDEIAPGRGPSGGDRADGDDPYLPSSEPTIPPPIDDQVEARVEGDTPERASDLAIRNVPGSAASHYTGLPGIAVVRPTEPFVRPDLHSTRPPAIALMTGRALFVFAALLLGIAARRAPGGRDDAFWPVAISSGVLTVVGIAAMAYWSVVFAQNARLLHTRSTSAASMGWSWLVPVGWVAASAVTYLRVVVDGDLDPLPGVAGRGFALALSIPFGKIRRIFTGLSRRPANVWLTLYPLDVVAFGLVWWRLTSWPDPLGAADADHVEFSATLFFASAALLVVGVGVSAWLAVQGTNGLFERLGRLEARARPEDERSSG